MVATRYRRRSATVAVIAVTALVPGVLALAPARSVPVASGGAGQVNVLALTSTHITGFPGRPVTVIKGKVWTAAATVSGPIGRSVSLQRLVGKKWTTAASAKTAKKGLVRIAVTPSSSGNYRLSVPAFGHFAGASSAAEQVTVKPAPALQTWPTTISGTFSGYARDPYNPVDGAHWSWEGNVIYTYDAKQPTQGSDVAYTLTGGSITWHDLTPNPGCTPIRASGTVNMAGKDAKGQFVDGQATISMDSVPWGKDRGWRVSFGGISRLDQSTSPPAAPGPFDSRWSCPNDPDPPTIYGDNPTLVAHEFIYQLDPGRPAACQYNNWCSNSLQKFDNITSQLNGNFTNTRHPDYTQQWEIHLVGTGKARPARAKVCPPGTDLDVTCHFAP